ncbi:rCG55259, isoform CRA_b [Rattus norvegicus]|uniref:RCG55259, isoform CRA_b n=1 Tax=Rattus norvegicus TaxID=10116 RepID=A6J7Y7_RAT|nr:rCG55259, isoform CRA_b [Rattus norvegicus]
MPVGTVVGSCSFRGAVREVGHPTETMLPPDPLLLTVAHPRERRPRPSSLRT